MTAFTLKSCLALASAALAVAHTPASVAATLSAKRLNQIASESAYSIGVNRACAQLSPGQFGSSRALADTLYANLMLLVERAGQDVEEFSASYDEGLDLVVAIQTERYSGHEPVFKSLCENYLTLARAKNDALAGQIKKLKTRQPSRTEDDDCPLAADTYQERVTRYGKTSDRACYQKAGVRELEQAQQSMLRAR